MANPVCEVLVSDAELESSQKGDSPSAGAILDFRGMVRGLEGGRAIRGLDYEANTAMAEHQLREIGCEAIERFNLSQVIVHHRIGFVAAGKASLFVRIAAGHRAEALQAMEWLIDELKKRVPIWKRPKFACNEPREGATDMAGRLSSQK
jgi:molybdopterin synthase catalytic subunit